MEIRENPLKSFEIHENQENTWKSIGIHENLYKLWKTLKIYEIHNIYGIYLFCKNKVGYILYSKHINASHICPSKKNKLFKHRKWKSWFPWKYAFLIVKRISQSHVLWKCGMIPRSFCPSRFPIKPQWKISFGQKCRFFMIQPKKNLKMKQWIWLRNLGLRTATSRPSRRASMSASISSP